MSSSFFRWSEQQLTLFCHLQPKASKDEFAGLHNGRLKIRITAPPVDGKANTHLIQFIARQFGLPKQQVSIVKGELGREKTLLLENPTKNPLQAQGLDFLP